MNGKLIVFEGVDGSGKRTQSESLIKELQVRGHAVRNYAFPDYEFSAVGPLIGRMLAGEFGDASKFHPEMIAPLFALERAEKAPAIKADLAAGHVVVCDRYVYSNIAHQASRLPLSKHEDFKRWVEHLEFDVLSLPKPDFTVLLDIENDVAIERRRLRSAMSNGLRPLDDYERDSNALGKARDIYLWLAKAESWYVFSSNINTRIEVVQSSILEAAIKFLEKSNPSKVSNEKYYS